MDNQTSNNSSSSSSSTTTIIAALSTLTPHQLSTLATTVSTTVHHHERRLASLLSSPPLFTHTLNHLYTLSLPQKSLLIAHHLLSFFHLLTPFFPTTLLPPNSRPRLRPRFRLLDLDSVLLLLLFCQTRQSHPNSLDSTSPFLWRQILSSHFSDTILTLSGLQTSHFDVMVDYVDTLVKSRRFVDARGCGGAASVAAVVALPSVAVKKGDGVECTICKEELGEGRDVCELPCQHVFHWMCVLPWFSRTNTCPCCRFQLPTDDVFGEIQRLWDVLLKLGQQSSDLLGNNNQSHYP